MAVRRISVPLALAFADTLGFGVVFPLLPFYVLRLDASEWVVGWVISAYFLVQLSSAPLWGRLSDRYGRRPVLLSGLLLSAVSFLVFGFAHSVLTLVLSQLIHGLGGGKAGVLQAYVCDAVPEEERAKSLAWLTAATSGGMMVGPAVGSLAFLIGPEAPGVTAALFCLANIAFSARHLGEPHGARIRATSGGIPRESADRSGKAAAPARPIRSWVWDILTAPGKNVSRLVWIYALAMCGLVSASSVLALYLQSDFGITEKSIGLFFVYMGATGLVMRSLVFGWLIDRLGEVGIFRLGVLSLAAGIFAIPGVNSVGTLVAFLALMPIGTACLFPSLASMVSRAVPEGEFGQALGIQQAFGGVARVLGPILATAAFQGLGQQVPFYVASGIVLLPLWISSRF